MSLVPSQDMGVLCVWLELLCVWLELEDLSQGSFVWKSNTGRHKNQAHMDTSVRGINVLYLRLMPVSRFCWGIGIAL